MKVIHYNVSGEVMELLQFLLSFLLGDGGKKFSPLLERFMKNGFNIKDLLSSLSLDTLAPIIQAFMGMQNKSPTQNVGQYFGLNPIANIADKEIVYTLNKYFSC